MNRSRRNRRNRRWRRIRCWPDCQTIVSRRASDESQAPFFAACRAFSARIFLAAKRHKRRKNLSNHIPIFRGLIRHLIRTSSTFSPSGAEKGIAAERTKRGSRSGFSGCWAEKQTPRPGCAWLPSLHCFAETSRRGERCVPPFTGSAYFAVSSKNGAK